MLLARLGLGGLFGGLEDDSDTLAEELPLELDVELLDAISHCFGGTRTHVRTLSTASEAGRTASG